MLRDILMFVPHFEARSITGLNTIPDVFSGARETDTPQGGNKMRSKAVIIGAVVALGLVISLAAFATAASGSGGDFLDEVAKGSSNSGKSAMGSESDGGAGDGSGPVMEQKKEQSQDGECVGDGEPVKTQEQTKEQTQDGECVGDGEPVKTQEQTKEQTQDGECVGDGEPVKTQEQTKEQTQDGECVGDGEPVKTQEQTKEQTQDGECVGDGEPVKTQEQKKEQSGEGECQKEEEESEDMAAESASGDGTPSNEDPIHDRDRDQDGNMANESPGSGEPSENRYEGSNKK